MCSDAACHDLAVSRSALPTGKAVAGVVDGSSDTVSDQMNSTIDTIDLSGPIVWSVPVVVRIACSIAVPAEATGRALRVSLGIPMLANE